MILTNLSIYCTWKNIKKLYKSKFKISGTTWDEEFELPDESCLVLNIQDYFEYIVKKHEIFADKLPVQIYVNKIQKRATVR